MQIIYWENSFFESGMSNNSQYEDFFPLKGGEGARLTFGEKNGEYISIRHTDTSKYNLQREMCAYHINTME